MRGKHIDRAKLPRRQGITPADAGKTYAPAPPQVQHRDHPRGCGENSHFSPFSVGFCRITPADAGKTTSDFRNVIIKEDHPRGCGENPFFICGY